MFITNSSTKLHNQLDPIRFQGGRRQCVSLVTVHSGLHDGHGAVINAAKTVSDVLVVAILPRQRSADAQGNVISATEFHDISYIEQHAAQVLYKPEENDLFPIDDESMVHVIKPENSLAIDFDPNVLLTYLKILNVDGWWISKPLPQSAQEDGDGRHPLLPLTNLWRPTPGQAEKDPFMIR